MFFVRDFGRLWVSQGPRGLPWHFLDFDETQASYSEKMGRKSTACVQNLPHFTKGGLNNSLKGLIGNVYMYITKLIKLTILINFGCCIIWALPGSNIVQNTRGR